MDDPQRIRHQRDEELRLLEQRKRDLAEGRLVPAQQALKQMRGAGADARKHLDNTDQERSLKR